MPIITMSIIICPIGRPRLINLCHHINAHGSEKGFNPTPKLMPLQWTTQELDTLEGYRTYLLFRTVVNTPVFGG